MFQGLKYFLLVLSFYLSNFCPDLFFSFLLKFLHEELKDCKSKGFV